MHNDWNICAKSEILTISGLGVRQGCGKVTKMIPFCHKIRHTKTINTKIFCELSKPFLLRIRGSFYGNPTRKKKVRGKKYFTSIP